MSTYPTRPGQLVRSASGTVGITAEYPAKRTPTIGVMFLGGSYEVRMELEELTVITLEEAQPPRTVEYPILNEDGTPLDDRGALFATVAKLSSVMGAKITRDSQRELEAPNLAAAAHGRMIGSAIIARDLITTFITRNTQEGAL